MYLHTFKQLQMKTTTGGMVRPITEPGNGVWMTPESARHYFRNGRGIAIGTMMNKIYSGRLNGFVKHDHLGWKVFIPLLTHEAKAA